MAAHLTSLTLSRFASAQVERLALHVAGGKTLPPAVLQAVVRKTDGLSSPGGVWPRRTLPACHLQASLARYAHQTWPPRDPLSAHAPATRPHAHHGRPPAP